MGKVLPQLVLNRNYTLVTIFGHVIRFTKDEPIAVPPAAYASAVAIGAVPADGTDPDVLDDAPKPREMISPQERGEKILAAIEMLVELNNRNDFTAAGSPSVKAVERELGFDVDRREIAAQWQVFHDKQAGELL